MNKTLKVVIPSAKIKFLERVQELMKSEKNRDQSIDFDYLESYKNIVCGELETFLKQVVDNRSNLHTYKLESFVSIEHLSIVEEQQIDMAFELNLKIRMH